MEDSNNVNCIPDGFELDLENSTKDKIVLKRKRVELSRLLGKFHAAYESDEDPHKKKLSEINLPHIWDPRTKITLNNLSPNEDYAKLIQDLHRYSLVVEYANQVFEYTKSMYVVRYYLTESEWGHNDYRITGAVSIKKIGSVELFTLHSEEAAKWVYDNYRDLVYSIGRGLSAVLSTKLDDEAITCN